MLNGVEEISTSNNEIKIVSINVDDEDELASKYNISSIPCLVLIENGEEINRSIGLISRSDLDSFIGGK